MKEGIGGHTPTPPAEQRLATAQEPSLAEVRQLGSGAIMEGICEGRITNPAALLIHFERFQDEYREEALRQQDKVKLAVLQRGGWNSLIHPQTAEDYYQLQQVCYSRFRDVREGNKVEDAHTDEEVQQRLQGFAAGMTNLVNMAEAFRQRADEVSAGKEPSSLYEDSAGRMSSRNR
jgi:hypothetical protein